MIPQFKLIFEDGSVFEGRSMNKDWNATPTKRVTEMLFCFAGVNVHLKNYALYNHLFETVESLGGKKRVTKFLIMGSKSRTTDIFEYDLVKKRFARRVVKIGDEYRGMKIFGWKAGFKKGKAEFHYVQSELQK